MPVPLGLWAHAHDTCIVNRTLMIQGHKIFEKESDVGMLLTGIQSTENKLHVGMLVSGIQSTETSTGHRQHQNEMCLLPLQNVFASQVQTWAWSLVCLDSV